MKRIIKKKLPSIVDAIIHDEGFKKRLRDLDKPKKKKSK